MDQPNYLAKVKEFHTVFGHPVTGHPTLFPLADDLANKTLRKLRVDLIEEEFTELKDALFANDIVEVADALADLAVVTLGAALVWGIPLDEVFAEVHRSNMSKLDANGQALRRADGKILKSDLYSPPDITSILAKPNV